MFYNSVVGACGQQINCCIYRNENEYGNGCAKDKQPNVGKPEDKQQDADGVKRDNKVDDCYKNRQEEDHNNLFVNGLANLLFAETDLLHNVKPFAVVISF